MTCRDAIDVIADFLDRTLASDIGRALERHLLDCEACRAYLNTYRKTRALASEVGRAEMPPELRRRLREFLLVQLGPPPC